MSRSHEIDHVGDTALMVAACRAIENQSADAMVWDSFADRLAGERGRALLELLPRPEWMRLGIALRTRFIDELLLELLAAQSIAVVLNIGCGLDSRPWRLDLPTDLLWIEVDFEDMLDYKDVLMAAEAPRCLRERLSADLNNPAQRRALYQAAGSRPALMITEGLLPYLPSSTVEALAAEAPAESGIAYWMSDISTSAFSRFVDVNSVRQVEELHPADSLHGEQVLEIGRGHGWMTTARRSYLTDVGFAMARIQRVMGPLAAGPPPVAFDDPTGIHLFARA